MKETGLPIPRLHFYGKEPPVEPYVMMDRIEIQGSVSARLTKPSKDSSGSHVQDPHISDSALEAIWGQIAQCYLQLHQLTFPSIVSLVENSSGNYEVAGRPITHNMTDMVKLANVFRCVLPPEGTTYNTADGWYVALVEMHIAQLMFQCNDAVVSEDDCRNKYWRARSSADWPCKASYLRLVPPTTAGLPSHSRSLHLLYCRRPRAPRTLGSGGTTFGRGISS